MTIDPTDYEPRPADDFAAAREIRKKWASFPRMSLSSFNRYCSLLERFKKTTHCHQLGCNFDELPHG